MSTLLAVSPSEHFGSGGEGGVQCGSLWGLGMTRCEECVWLAVNRMARCDFLGFWV